MENSTAVSQKEVQRICSYDALPITMTITDVCEILNLSPTTVYNLVRGETLKAIQLGRKYLIPKSSLISYLEMEA